MVFLWLDPSSAIQQIQFMDFFWTVLSILFFFSRTIDLTKMEPKNDIVWILCFLSLRETIKTYFKSIKCMLLHQVKLQTQRFILSFM